MFRIIIFLVKITISVSAQANPIDNVVELLKNNKINALVQYFDARIELNIYNKTSQYPKAQAGIIVKDFFYGKKIDNIIVANRNDRGATQFGGVNITVNGNSFKLKFTTNTANNNFVITTFSVETG